MNTKQKASAAIAAAGLLTSIYCAFMLVTVGGSGVKGWMAIGLAFGLIGIVGMWASGLPRADSDQHS